MTEARSTLLPGTRLPRSESGAVTMLAPEWKVLPTPQNGSGPSEGDTHSWLARAELTDEGQPPPGTHSPSALVSELIEVVR